jgi:hypothetical protein
MKVNPETDSTGGGGDSFFCSPGRKLCTAVGMRRWTASTGTPMLTMGFVVLRDGAKTGDDGKVFLERFPMVQGAAFRIARWAKAQGWASEFDAEQDEDVLRIMARGPVVAVLKEDTYKGKTRTEVDPDGWAPFTGDRDPAWDAMTTAGEHEFNAIQQRMAGKASGGAGASNGSSNGSSHGNPGHPNAPGNGGGGQHDDIPF